MTGLIRAAGQSIGSRSRTGSITLLIGCRKLTDPASPRPVSTADTRSAGSDRLRNPHHFDKYHRRSITVCLRSLIVSYRTCWVAGQLKVADRAIGSGWQGRPDFSACGRPTQQGDGKCKPKVRTGWRVRASTRSSPDQMLSYLGIAEMPTLALTFALLRSRVSGAGGTQNNRNGPASS